MSGKILITSFVCMGLLVLYGCSLPNEDETYTLSQDQLVDFSGAYAIELSPEPGFNSFTLFHTGNKVTLYDNLGRTWKGDASGISQTQAGTRPVAVADQEQAEYLQLWQMQFSVETEDPATGRRAVMVGEGTYYERETYDPWSGVDRSGQAVHLDGEYWTNYGPKGPFAAWAWTMEERLPGGTTTTQ